MKKIGLIVAVEMESLIRVFGQPDYKERSFGYNVYEYNLKDVKLIVCESGAGEILAAGATEHLICKFNVEVIINFGVAGGLRKEMTLFKNCIVRRVVHYDYDISSAGNFEIGQYISQKSKFIETSEQLAKDMIKINPELISVNCASGDKFVTEREKRINLANKFQCDICEMEAAGILIICKKNHIPCLLIKTVSDDLNHGADDFFKYSDKAADICMNMIKSFISVISLD